MTSEIDRHGNMLPDKNRLTNVGKFLRSTSLDELPELINIIKGDMSFVGPRPLLLRYLERYSPRQFRRHELPPGLTGWAQINGRNALSWQERFEMDIWYIDNQSLILDLKIILLTLVKVVRREGIQQSGEATMKEFIGT
jgi:lipopolysaccharide/colanic/teichoic acid biosynthesis glycosyltransferase